MRRKHLSVLGTFLAVSFLVAMAGAGNTNTLDDAVAASDAGDYVTAVRILRPLAEQGNASAQNSLGWMYAKGKGVKKDNSEAVKWFRKAAEQGNANAQYATASMYRGGHGVAKNYAEAAKWYRKSAEQGNASAQVSLGDMYYRSQYEGHALAQNDAEAARWYRKAAEKGDAGAIYRLGRMYDEGRGVAQSFLQAHKWDNIAGALGSRSARRHRDKIAKKMTSTQIIKAQKLAREWMTKNRQGVAKDAHEASNRLQIAAEQGDAKAQSSLGEMYYNGRDAAQDYAEAAKWYRKAAEQGWTAAQHILGLMHRYGHGVERNKLRAHALLNIAGANNFKPARVARDSLAREMTPSQIAEAQNLAREWMARHP
jgi:uncharacterized protein